MWNRFCIVLIFFSIVSLQAQDYQLGHGLKLADALNLGAYFSTEYEYKEDEEKAKIDDIAFLMYGQIDERFSYLAELEAANFYEYDFKDRSSSDNTTFQVERLYVDYMESDYLRFRAGKFITPIGYWNLEPINVLRDTTSNPLYSYTMFPKFVTGVNLSGYLSMDESVQYNIFAQGTRDLDEEYMNILNDHFFGASLEKEFSPELTAGLSVGEFVTLTNERYVFLQCNAKYDSYPFKLFGEGVIRSSRDTQKHYSEAMYLQGSYNYSLEHMLVTRFEYFEEEELSQNGESLFLLGYSYRPIYPVSLKAEYQWHSLKEQDKFLVSFSVIF
ncbi:MAG: hypothetical protein J7J31_02120 [Helicobacteraceae bacterium]|nr:hypothetical protein [Helicobacteraceae bacterium]